MRRASVRISIRVGADDAHGICKARVFHGRRKVEEFETTQAEVKELFFRIRGKGVPPKIRAAALAARQAREDLGRTSYWRLVAAIHLTIPPAPEPAFQRGTP